MKHGEFYIESLENGGLDELRYQLGNLVKELQNYKTDEIINGNWAENIIEEMHDVQYLIDEKMESYGPPPANDEQWFPFHLINSEDANACYRYAHRIIKIIENWTLKTETDAEMKKLYAC